jgi:hypothetical protein
MELTQTLLKLHLHYDSETGVFTRLISTNGGVCIGDIAGTVHPTKYRFIQVAKNMYAAHRLAFLYMTGEFPPHDVDHINGARNDNRWANLRAVTRYENTQNTAKNRNNTSGVMGVHWHKLTGKWQAYIGGKHTHIGLFDNWFEAVCARKSAENRLGYHPNHGRSGL